MAAFKQLPHADFLRVAETFARYRLTSLDIIRRADRVARRMSLSDLWELGRRPFHQMQPIMQLMAHFTPQITKSRAGAKEPVFGELVIPDRLRDFPDGISSMGVFLKPYQLTTNYASRELARGKCQTPSYTPYIAAGVSFPHLAFPVR